MEPTNGRGFAGVASWSDAHIGVNVGAPPLNGHRLQLVFDEQSASTPVDQAGEYLLCAKT